uniref:Winged helix DNA-binding domain-containing protein n=1 Tax=Spongospora subterranea TaxID=70186 RepID=A0A0H5QNI1_9EUKA|eukprot:CRZ03137.1 hypothetical protein [Spongospora subterranea]
MDKVRQWRMSVNGLYGTGFQSPESVADALFGVQAQEHVASVISIWNRLQDGSHLCGKKNQRNTIDKATILAKGDNLIKLWGQRGTLHVFCIKDWPIVASSFGQALLDQRNNRVADPLQIRRHVDRIVKEFESNSHQTNRDRFDPMISRGIRMMLTLEGHGAWRYHSLPNKICNLTPRSSLYPSTWNLPPRLDALRVAALRYFASYGPALEIDFRFMMGITALPSKTVIASLIEAGELVQITIDARPYLLPSVLKRQFESFIVTSSPVRLLYKFDPILLAHSDKSWLIEPEYKARVWGKCAVVHATVLIKGKISGIWKLSWPRKLQAKVDITLFHDIKASDRKAIDMQIAGIARCLQAEEYCIDYHV